MKGTTSTARRGLGTGTSVLLALGIFAGTAMPVRAASIFTPVTGAGGVVPSNWKDKPGHAQMYGWGAATMPDGSVLMGDYWNYRIQKATLNADGSVASIDPTFISNPGFQPGQHQAPYGIGVDPGSGSIYFADTDRYTVDMYDADGNYIMEWGSQGSGVNKYLYPSRVAVRSDGQVYVNDTWNNQIVVVNVDPVAKTATEVGTFGAFGTDTPGHTNPTCKWKQPHGMAWWYGPDGTDSIADDRLYVTDTNNKEIDVYGSNPLAGGCQQLFTFGRAGSLPSQFKGDLRGLAIDASDPTSPTGASVYVVDAAGNKIRKFDTNGVFMSAFGIPSKDDTNPGPGEFSDGGREITVDQFHRVWVGDMPDYRFQVFNGLNGQFQFAVPGVPLNTDLTPPVTPTSGSWYVPPSTSGFNGPRGIAIDAAGNRFVTDTYNQRILKYDASGAFVTQWGSRGRTDYAFNYPRMLAISPVDQSVWVADTDNHMIKKFSNDGVFQCKAGGLGDVGPLMRNPHGIDVAPDGTVYVTDTRNGLIKAFDQNCNWLFSSTYPKGTTAQSGQMTYVRGIAYDPTGGPDGSVWVAESNQDVIKHYAIDRTSATPFTWIETYGSKGTLDPQFKDPFDLEVVGSTLIVADTGNNQLKVWNTATDSFVEAYGGGGTKPGKFQQLQGLDVSPVDGHLWTCEQRNERLQQFILSI
jgi:tripartite motif-containing protein 71